MGIIYIEQYIASDGLRVWSVVTGTIFGYYGGSARCGVRGEVYGREVRGAWPQGGCASGMREDGRVGTKQ